MQKSWIKAVYSNKLIYINKDYGMDKWRVK